MDKTQIKSTIDNLANRGIFSFNSSTSQSQRIKIEAWFILISSIYFLINVIVSGQLLNTIRVFTYPLGVLFGIYLVWLMSSVKQRNKKHVRLILFLLIVLIVFFGLGLILSPNRVAPISIIYILIYLDMSIYIWKNMKSAE